MAKDTFYFSHDYNVRTDDKIKKLLVKHSMLGYGIYWAIVENLYNNTNVLQLDYESISYELHADIKVVKSVIHDFDLFIVLQETFSSNSVQRRLDERNSKSIKAKESISKRWGNTNVIRTNNECNTIKERKGKEIKGKEKKESGETSSPTPSVSLDEKKEKLILRKKEFGLSLQDFSDDFPKDMITAFYRYWTEPNRSFTKLKFELERTWDTKRRLDVWQSNENKFVNKHPSVSTEQKEMDEYLKNRQRIVDKNKELTKIK
jgi:hypothetical protein